MKSRPTTYKAIPMRSRLEAGYAAWLDQKRIAWSYEPHCFASENGQYLPDFRIDARVSFAGHVFLGKTYVEVKPRSCADLVPVARRMRIILDSEPNAALLIAREGDDVHWLVHDLDGRQDPHQPSHWAAAPMIIECDEDGHHAAVGFVAPGCAGPWPDGYWEGPASTPPVPPPPTHRSGRSPVEQARAQLAARSTEHASATAVPPPPNQPRSCPSGHRYSCPTGHRYSYDEDALVWRCVDCGLERSRVHG